MKKILFVVTLAFLASAVYSQRVNFTGSWKLNEKESLLFDQFTLAPNTLVIKHKRKSFEVERNNVMDGQELITTDVLTLDGEECENKGWTDAVKTSTASLDKKTGILLVNSKMMIEGMNVEIEEEFSMDGDKLVMISIAMTDMGNLEEKFIFDKQ